MSAASGISASEELLKDFSDAVTDRNIRFLKIAIQNEALVPQGSWPSKAEDLASDLSQLDGILVQDVPAYILARLDTGNEWLFISYVPDIAKVRDKMLYASSRSALVKALGGQAVKDTLFATSKKDLSPEAYAAHLRHVAAPKPMSAREAELAEIQAAERQSSTAFEGSRARKNHVGAGVGVVWTAEVEDAVKSLAAGQGANLLIIGIASETEGVKVIETKEVAVDALASALPRAEPSYAFYRWQPEKIVFIYTCPSSSGVKLRMVYSMGVSSVTQTAQETAGFKIFKKLEASDPSDLDLSFAQDEPPASAKPTGPPSFARPRGPPRKR
ncbi:Twinfilin-1 [Tulasnella sp. 424]|nr:Twinfilin-1 [Tulasnella sp. 424]KAG8977868.1 Twinfilin-1 [Tulasnella sp. 425]